MKVIFAGMPKTGTKSMCAALSVLGYNVYDFMENCEFLDKEWTKILKEGGTVEDLRKMYESVDAVTDIPCGQFWEELSHAFPQAKIVFSMRDEDEWIRSVRSHVKSLDVFYYKLLMMVSPTCWKMNRFYDTVSIACFGYISRGSLFKKSVVNETLLRQTYRRHNAYVLEKAPKDRFLLFNPKDGWAPLCKFLGVDVPNTPYPQKNVKGGIVKELLQTNKLLIRVQREAMFSFGVLAALLGYTIYRAVSGKTFGIGTWILSAVEFVSSAL